MALNGEALSSKREEQAAIPPSPHSTHITAKDVRHESQQPLFAARIPIVPIAAAVFLAAFSGAALYGIRAGRKAELKEAADLVAANARQACRSGAARAAPATPSALSRTRRPQDTPHNNSSPSADAHPSSSSALALDWGSGGSTAPSALSKRGVGVPSSRSGFAAAPSNAQGTNFTFDEPPALTAVKAFTIATALVGVTSVAAVEVARRVWKVEDMYDLTDRLHAVAPKSVTLFEKMGRFMRSRLEGIFPEPVDHQDSLAAPLLDSSDVSRKDEVSRSAALSNSQSFDILRKPSRQTQETSSPPDRRDEDVTQHKVKDVESLFIEMEQAATMREKLELLEIQLRSEKAHEDKQREELRRHRQHRSSNMG